MGPCEVPRPKVIFAMVLSGYRLSRFLSTRNLQSREQPAGVVLEDISSIFLGERLDRIDQRLDVVERLSGLRIGCRSRAGILGSEHYVLAARNAQQQLERLARVQARIEV